jgi:transcriptional regulator with XRE-family HTH domain
MKRFSKPHKKPADDKGVDPMLKWVWMEMQQQRISQVELANRTGFSGASLRNWFQGRSSPEYSSVRAMVNALGYDLLAEPIR